MKLFKSSFWLYLLLLTGVLAPAPSFGQVSSARAVADTIDLVPGLARTYDLLANDTILANDTLKSVNIVLSHIPHPAIPHRREAPYPASCIPHLASCIFAYFSNAI